LRLKKKDLWFDKRESVHIKNKKYSKYFTLTLVKTRSFLYKKMFIFFFNFLNISDLISCIHDLRQNLTSTFGSFFLPCFTFFFLVIFISFMVRGLLWTFLYCHLHLWFMDLWRDIVMLLRIVWLLCSEHEFGVCSDHDFWGNCCYHYESVFFLRIIIFIEFNY
jgi:hypothetical protein